MPKKPGDHFARLVLPLQGPRKVDKAQVEKWLREQWPSPRCPISGHTTWIIGDHYVQPIPYPMPVPTTGAGYPMVMLICNGCGYTMHFNAVLMGLLGKQDG
jgi:hypothetical protein